MAILFSCEETLFIDCSECSSEDPEEAFLTVKLSTEYGETDVTIYVGNLEENIVFNTYTSYSKAIYCKVPVNKKYTLTAKYLYKGSTYFTVNSVTPRVKFVEDRCEEPCYFIYDREVDLKLKNN
jgi:uncharacterized CHY-type Zn-finger protein